MNSPEERGHGITYRAATPEDAGAISKLVLNSQAKFTFHEYTEEGRARMVRQLSPEAVADTFSGGNVIFVAETAARLVGVVSIRNKKHLSLNFVDEEFHQRGISRELWALGKGECIRRGNPGRFTLRSSTYAIPVYERWGFVRNGPIDRTGGILSHPMVLDEQSIDQDPA